MYAKTMVHLPMKYLYVQERERYAKLTPGYEIQWVYICIVHPFNMFHRTLK